MAFSTPVIIVDPPGCKAQSKSAAAKYFPVSVWSEIIDELRLSNADETDADARIGTRGERTTFQPIQRLVISLAS